MKKNVLLFIVLLFGGCINAQTLFNESIYPGNTPRNPLSISPLITNAEDSDYLVAQVWYKRLKNGYLAHVLQILKLDEDGKINTEKQFIWDWNPPSQILICNDGSHIIIGHTAIDGKAKVNVIKINAEEQVVWSKGYNSNLVFSGTGVFKNGDKLVISSDNMNVSKGMWWTNAGVMTIDYNTGNFLSYNIYGTGVDASDSVQSITGLLPTKDSGYLLYGLSYFGQGVLLIKFDKDENLQWSKHVDVNNNFFTVNGIVQTNDDGFAVCGSVRDNTQRIHSSAFKVDVNGNLLWIKQFTTQFSQTNNEDFKAMVINTDGSLFIEGNRATGHGFVNVLLKMDDTGNILWTKYDSHHINSNYTSMAIKNNIIMSCSEVSPSDKTSQSGSTRIAAFDTLGNNCFNMTNLTYTSSDLPYTTGDYHLQKNSYDSINTSNFPIINSELGDNIIANVCDNNINDAVKLLPQQHFNVALVSNVINSNQLNLKLSSEINTQAQVIIKGLSGEVFTKQSIFIKKGSVMKDITLPNLLPGIYFVQVFDATENHSAKFYKN